MHFCADELFAILALVPGVAFAWAWLRAKIHHRDAHNGCDKGLV